MRIGVSQMVREIEANISEQKNQSAPLSNQAAKKGDATSSLLAPKDAAKLNPDSIIAKSAFRMQVVRTENLTLNRAGGTTIDSTQTLEGSAEKGGILKSHLEGISKVATKFNEVIAIRPVNKLSTGLIEEGYPTKGMNIKGKSSDWGPMAGFIAVDQSYSKIASKDLSEGYSAEDRQHDIEKFSGKVQDSVKLGKGVCESATLCISKNRIDMLAEEGLITIPNEKNESLPSGEMKGFVLEAKPNSADGKTQSFFAQEVGGGQYEIFKKGEEGKWEGLQILALDMSNSEGEETNLKGITADYDLLFVAPELGDFSSSRDQLAFPEVTAGAVVNKFAKELSQRSKDNLPQQVTDSLDYVDGEGQAKPGAPVSVLKTLDAKYGNSSARVTDLIIDLNAACHRVDAPVVHHGSDEGNPFSEEKDNYPSTVILPQEIIGADGAVVIPKVAVIENAEQMEELFVALKDANYAPRANPNWDGRVVGAKRTSFIEAKEILLQTLELRQTPDAETARDLFRAAIRPFEGGTTL